MPGGAVVSPAGTGQPSSGSQGRGSIPKGKMKKHIAAPMTLIFPAVVLYLIFFIWPAAIGLYYSFTNYKGMPKYKTVGLKNYTTLLADHDFWAALLRTFEFIICSVPLNVCISLLAAILVTSRKAIGHTLARTLFFIPWLVSPIITGLIWRWMFGEGFGIVNQVIQSFGGHGLRWATDANLSFAVLVLAGVWAGMAFNMLLFITALKNVPESLYEAASLDGANAWQRFVNVTLPGIAPTMFMVVLLGTIGGIKEFAMVQALNGGGPGTSNRLVVQYIYETGFSNSRIGYASAASMILLVILVIVSLIQMWFNKRNGGK
ncbi:sugar ABC transporter permease [Bombiscardovia nodaiensis]|uniref:Sugar ABC transporter permease n=1 Tax=Bombiscardovia nodaiensis TaxID=2932181 RepID=A0ABM8B5S9_9BIFI|nr:sugar ABC transporter permease [Bombiscardovia nodaiensis]